MKKIASLCVVLCVAISFGCNGDSQTSTSTSKSTAKTGKSTPKVVTEPILWPPESVTGDDGTKSHVFLPKKIAAEDEKK